MSRHTRLAAYCYFALTLYIDAISPSHFVLYFFMGSSAWLGVLRALQVEHKHKQARVWHGMARSGRQVIFLPLREFLGKLGACAICEQSIDIWYFSLELM
jgi:hypothetical protein